MLRGRRRPRSGRKGVGGILARRDGYGLEVLLLVSVLVGGAGLRYWLSTALPFDASELAALADATAPDRSLRVPFIMLNGASLFALYLLVRRSAGAPAALAVLLLLQTSLGFQEQALRIRWLAAPLLIAMFLVTTWRHTRPPGRAPAWAARGLAVLAGLLALRGLYVGATLPARLETLRRESAADPGLLFASVERCGGGVVTALERLRGCPLAWPDGRSLDQQEALLEHLQRLGGDAAPLDGPAALEGVEPSQVAVFDPAAVALLAVAPGATAETAERVVRGAAPGFFGELGR